MHKPSTTINREEIIKHVANEGRITSRFFFMVIISCAVATMGLLQSSPAVLIGAMLISPLMSPIMALGFSFCIMDYKMLCKSLMALFLGILIALLVSFTLVSLSPLNDLTPEIMSRTSPNLLDLVIAVFSALAGGYSIIKRKDETLVGVAIATALMPPLAVMGYGLATGKMEIASGSFFLFMTNLLAIALTVTLVAVWYGFGYRHGEHYGKWQVSVVVIVFAVLSIPLGDSLKHIAYETIATQKARGIMNEYFTRDKTPARIELFHIAFPQKNEVHIDTVILTREYNTKAHEDILKKLQPALGNQVTFSLDQIVLSKDPADVNALTLQKATNTLVAPTTITQPILVEKSLDKLAQLREALSIPAEIFAVANSPSAFIIYPKPIKGGTLGIYRKIEQKLSMRFNGLEIKIVPPISQLPFIYFEKDKTTLDMTSDIVPEDTLWALSRLPVERIEIIWFTNLTSELEAPPSKSVAFVYAQQISKQLESTGLRSKIKVAPKILQEDMSKIELRVIPPEEVSTIESTL